MAHHVAVEGRVCGVGPRHGQALALVLHPAVLEPHLGHGKDTGRQTLTFYTRRESRLHKQQIRTVRSAFTHGPKVSFLKTNPERKL